jgi:hypothetical protein
MTFHTCSSPAPTPVKPQPVPAILSKESVHTTLSITHHTRKRPSNGPRTTHGPQLVQDAEPIRTIFKQIQGQLPRDLKAKMLEVAYIENQ